MNCPKCKVELEIFVGGESEFYVCPLCLSVLLEQASSAKGLKHFCKKELLSSAFSTLAEPSAFDIAEPMLKNQDNLACPKCRAIMKADTIGRLKFFANKCPKCSSIRITAMQAPLLCGGQERPGRYVQAGD
jgi:Zn-finger nucleic acid-binding protein